MKRFIGLFMSIAGGVMVLWSGIYVMTGRSAHLLEITPDYSLSAMMGGLISVFPSSRSGSCGCELQRIRGRHEKDRVSGSDTST